MSVVGYPAQAQTRINKKPKQTSTFDMFIDVQSIMKEIKLYMFIFH